MSLQDQFVMERWYGLLCDYLVKCEFMEPMMWSDHTSWSVILMMDQLRFELCKLSSELYVRIL